MAMTKKMKGLFGRTDGESGKFDVNIKVGTKSLGRWSNSMRRMVFQLGSKMSLENGRALLEERVSLFHGKTNHVRCLSVNDLNTHSHDWIHYDIGMAWFPYQCVWEGRPVFVKLCYDHISIEEFCRDIAIATEMGIHKNVHKLLACCLETETPVLIYEYLQNGTLYDSISYTSEALTHLEWKDRLRIASEISHAAAFLHTRFPRPIIHRCLAPCNVLLDENNAAKLTDFSRCVSIPKGETSVENEPVGGILGYMAPEYVLHGRLVEKSDVYSFGVLFIELLTGERHKWSGGMHIVPIQYDALYPEIIKCVNAYNNVAATSQTLDEYLIRKQILQESIELAFRCVAEEEDSRPTMEEVATEIKNIITYSASFNSSLPQPPLAEMDTGGCSGCTAPP